MGTSRGRKLLNQSRQDLSRWSIKADIGNRARRCGGNVNLYDARSLASGDIDQARRGIDDGAGPDDEKALTTPGCRLGPLPDSGRQCLVKPNDVGPQQLAAPCAARQFVERLRAAIFE